MTDPCNPWPWVKDNVPVWYRPSLRGEERYAGRVDGEPWSAGGDGETWMVHLDEMEPGYRNGRGTVKAAYLGALEPREENQVAREVLSFKKGQHMFWLHTMGNNGHPYPTQQETTRDDLRAVLSRLQEQGDYSILHEHLEHVVSLFECILDTGTNPGIVFGGVKTAAFAKRLMELRSCPDPDFGVDPKDSEELCTLRQLIDDNLVWPDPGAEEQGRYDRAVEYSGKLAKRMQFMQKAYYDAERELP